ncbi:quinone-dependent dihydroorotate dehydrogenase [Roseivirga sp. BDSF3-8]|uniref:quinone-dependent dihydroorotate dehydrogenase n=1 Tax=Roseivirga sp. BDSF3-8 TaxID=3241598 RepID=UPI0035321A6F
MYKNLIRPFLFRMPAEKAHHFTFNLIRRTFRLPGVASLFGYSTSVQHPALHRKVFGLDFPNPVGLAAGFDKDAKLIDEMARLGFGFIEIGTLTPMPQQGNPQPRLFRLQDDQGLINRMGFNNEGLEAAVERLKKRRSGVIVGGNIGKNKVTPNEEATEDYLKGFDTLYKYVDYFVVNVSSPNTPGLRELQEKEPLTRLLSTLKERNTQMPVQKPILLKIAPDLTNEQLDDIIDIVKSVGVDGLIATNTTIDRSNLKTPDEEVKAIGAGGLSGKPLRARSTEVIRYMNEKSGGTIPIIGVGGIMSASDALEKLDAGASLVQLYTGFIYEGPSLIRQINQALMRKAGN